MEGKMGLDIAAGPNGHLPLDFGWRGAFKKLLIAGGPYDFFPGRDKAFGVCVRAERVDPSELDLHVPIRDFGVPKDEEALRRVIIETLRAALSGRQVYVGCMGGWGRTGLFLALLAKAAGVENPVGYVREHYSARAVETQEQKRFVDRFDVGPLPSDLFVAAWRNRFFEAFGLR
jgi:hypothetical protein